MTYLVLLSGLKNSVRLASANEVCYLMPSPFKRDESWHLKRCPDVAEGIESGEIVVISHDSASHGSIERRVLAEV